MNIIPKPIRQQKKSKNRQNYIFSADIANKYGPQAAIIIQHFQYAIHHHKRNNTHFHEGRYWTYNSINSLMLLYPFWSPKIIRNIINHLVVKNVLITGNYNKNTYDRTKWFAFKNEDQFILSDISFNSMVSNDLDISVDESVDNSVDKNNLIKNSILFNSAECLGFSNSTKNDIPFNSMHSKDHKGSVYKSVDNILSKRRNKYHNNGNKKLGNEPIIFEQSSEIGRSLHLPVGANGFAPTGKSFTIYSSIYNSSVVEEEQPNNNNGGSLKKYFGRKNTNTRQRFSSKITTGYKMPDNLRSKIHRLGFTNYEIDKEILSMIRYHEGNPQIILNEHSCVLGWFENSRKQKRKK